MIFCLIFTGVSAFLTALSALKFEDMGVFTIATVVAAGCFGVAAEEFRGRMMK